METIMCFAVPTHPPAPWNPPPWRAMVSLAGAGGGGRQVTVSQGNEVRDTQLTYTPGTQVYGHRSSDQCWTLP